MTPTLQNTTVTLQSTSVSNEDEIDVIIFVNDDSEIPVMIENSLSRMSTLEAVIKERDVSNEFGMDLILDEGDYLTTLAYSYCEKDYRFCIIRSEYFL